MERLLVPGRSSWWCHYWDICPRGRREAVTGDVPPHALVFGNPARQHGYVCRCAGRLTNIRTSEDKPVGWCEICGQDCLIEMGK